MARLITALFDSRADAEAARDRLKASSVDISSLHIVDQSTQGYSDTSYSTRENRGFWASLKDAFLPDDDRHTYEEGVRRGGYLLTGEVGDHEVDDAVRILEEASTVDIDDRANSWKSSGWNPGSTAGVGGLGAAGMAADYDRAPAASYDDRGAMRGDRAEEVIPVVEEQLVVGKREVERGGVRVRSYVVERPVTESVGLREEHVSVERRAVDQPLSSVTEDAFRERSIAMTETSEEAVVGKTARVVEEVVVRKDVGERVETVSDTVRRTEVEVDNDVTTLDRDRSASYGDRTVAGAVGGTAAAAAGTVGAAARDAGSTVAGLANEAVGNIKQGLGNLTGSESLRQDGVAQERKGEAQKDRY